MQTLYRAQYAFLAFLLVFLAACQPLGIPKPETFNERLAFGYSTVTTARQTALTLLQSGKISADDAQQVQGQADNARTGLDIARSLSATEPQAADTKLTAILTALTALDAYLKSRGAQ